MNIQSNSFLRPIKKLPSRIIYKSTTKTRVLDDLNGGKTRVYTYKMYDLKDKKLVGTMKAGPVLYKNTGYKLYPINAPYKSFYIAHLETVESGYGYGTDFIKLAKHESENSGCEGRVHLIASRLFDHNNSPHIFYRKLGFTSVSPYINEMMDFFIGVKKPLPLEYAENLDMFLPMAKKKSTLQLKFSSLLNFIKEKFTK